MAGRRGLIAGVGIVGSIITLEYTGYGPFSNSVGVKNIEDRYSSGGGSRNHLPATGTRLGDANDVRGRHVGDSNGEHKYKDLIADTASGGPLQTKENSALDKRKEGPKSS